MSYATSLLTTYPSYDRPGLLSDDLILRSNYNSLYPSSLPYGATSRLLNNDLSYNGLNINSPPYRSSVYDLGNSNPGYPTTNYRNPLSNDFHRTVPPNDSFALSNDITEYSDSLATASNTNTASSVARSINHDYGFGTKKKFSNPGDNYDQIKQKANQSLQNQSVWSSLQRKKVAQSNEAKANKGLANPGAPAKKQNQPVVGVHALPSSEKINDDVTPAQSSEFRHLPNPQLNEHLERNQTINQIENQPTSVNVEEWLKRTKEQTVIDEKAAEEAWSAKISQLQMAQVQREKEKAKSSRALPNAAKKTDKKPIGNKAKSVADTKSGASTYETHQDSYFDSLFDGDFFRKPSTNVYPVNLSYNQPISTRTKLQTNSFNTPYDKPVRSKKTSRYEPPTTKRQPPAITTSSWRKQVPTYNQYDSLYPYYLQNEFPSQDNNQRDTEDRFREALHRLRADRAEQKQKGVYESTVKRLHYGDYVRNLAKDGLLPNNVKPSPWSDFMDLKKGNLYNLSQEEKKQLYKQSKSYGERIRYRNISIHHGDETSRSRRHSVPLTDAFQEPAPDEITPRPHGNPSTSVSRTSRRPDSGSTIRTNGRQRDPHARNRSIPNTNSRATMHTDPTDNYREFDHKNGYFSDHDQKSKQDRKKKTVRYAKYDSSGRVTNGTDESENENDNRSQRSYRRKNNDVDDDLFTVREEKTLESFEGARYKRR